MPDGHRPEISKGGKRGASREALKVAEDLREEFSSVFRGVPKVCLRGKPKR